MFGDIENRLAENSSTAIEIPAELKSLYKSEIIAKIGNKQFHCQKHGDFVSKPNCIIGNTIFFFECPKCAEIRKLKRENQAMLELAEEQKRAKEFKERLLLLSGVSPRYFETELKETPFFKDNQKFLRHNGVEFEVNRNIVMLEKCGVGKSFLAYRIMDIAMDLGLNYTLIKSKDMQLGYKTTAISDLRDFLKDIDCLIIDEVDDVLGDLELVNYAISHLYDQNKRVILIGNCDAETLKNAMPPKIYDRLSQGTICTKKSKDYFSLRKPQQ